MSMFLHGNPIFPVPSIPINLQGWFHHEASFHSSVLLVSFSSHCLNYYGFILILDSHRQVLVVCLSSDWLLWVLCSSDNFQIILSNFIILLMYEFFLSTNIVCLSMNIFQCLSIRFLYLQSDRHHLQIYFQVCLHIFQGIINVIS